MQVSSRFLSIAGLWLLSAVGWCSVLLQTNGTIINGSAGGFPASIITNPNLNFGTNANPGALNILAEDFTVTSPAWGVNRLDFIAYQGSSTSFTFDSADISIYQGDQPNAARLLFSGNAMSVTNGGFVGYRVASTSLTLTNRPCYRITVDLPFGVVLPIGRYWVTYSIRGSLASGPFVPQVMDGQVQPIPGNAHVSNLGGSFLLASWGTVSSNTSTFPQDVWGENCGEKVLVNANFETGTLGWKVVKLSAILANPPVVLASHNPTWPAEGQGGNAIRFSDIGTGIAYWSAPIGFLGNKSEAYLGYLRYNYECSSADTPLEVIDVVMVGASLTLISDHSTPAGFWRNGRVPFQVGFWRVLGGGRATDAQIKSVLADLDALYIRAEYDTTADNYRLDNVAMACHPPTNNLLANPSFESPNVGTFQNFANGSTVGSGWTVHNADAAVSVVDNAYIGGGVAWHDTPLGDQFAYVGGSLMDGEIRQAVSLTAGTTYKLAWHQASFASGTTGQVKLSLLNSANAVVLPPQQFHVNAQDTFERKVTTFQVPSSGQYRISFAAIAGEVAIIDNVELYPVGVVNGTVNLVGLVPDELGKTVTVVVDTAEGTFEKEVTLGVGGKFEIVTNQCSSAVVWVKGAKWLANGEKSPISIDSVNLEFNLLPGDCNNDNFVTTDDYLILNASFDRSNGEPGYDDRADFTGDRYVGTDDYLLFNDYFDRAGVERPE